MFNKAMFKWFWTIVSLGAPDESDPTNASAELSVNATGELSADALADREL